MVHVPPYGNYTFSVQGVQVEGWLGFPGVTKSMQPDVQFEWESTPHRLHPARRLADVVENDTGFDIDKHPVTNVMSVQYVCMYCAQPCSPRW